MESKLNRKRYHNEWDFINGFWMQFVEYLSETEEVWSYEAGGKETLYHRHLK